MRTRENSKENIYRRLKNQGQLNVEKEYKKQPTWPSKS